MAIAPLKHSDHEFRFPQFGLRTLLVVVALAAVLFSVMGWIGPVPSAGLLLGLVIVGLHVVGNAVGTSLRDRAPSRPPAKSIGRDPPSELAAPRDNLPVSQLQQRTPLGWIVRVAVLLGSGFGAWLGFDVLGQWVENSNFGLFVGTTSLAILGGFVGFLLGSFLKMSLMAWWQAAHVDPAHYP